MAFFLLTFWGVVYSMHLIRTTAPNVKKKKIVLSQICILRNNTITFDTTPYAVPQYFRNPWQVSVFQECLWASRPQHTSNRVGGGEMVPIELHFREQEIVQIWWTQSVGNQMKRATI